METSIVAPSVCSSGYFIFKEPLNTYLKNKFNLDPLTVKLKVSGIISMKDMIRNDLKDPFSELYAPAGLSEIDYKKDLIDNVPIISISFIDILGVERLIRVPLNYIESISSVSDIEYMNKLLVIDLNKLPAVVDTTLFFNDLSDFIQSRMGLTPSIKEVNVGNIELVDTIEHTTRETVRINTITVYKTLATQLTEANLRYDQVINRLTALDIHLGT